ncbi:polysaccharide pyruvyl transferase family protein [Erythrobacter sp. YT30]|uniref:polysaccharide pyruvyl transferase family protein n=1 Tax=Erythrobacter sp. YT30 TaxID=1735012 RepID=UPI000B11E2B1|nr:polysaccharide pyruvyl transferase family protein [Erythrobacter sp. YT30]
MKKFIITGVQMRNKGSQAMLLSLYFGLKAQYPDCQVTGFVFKYDELDQYNLSLLPHDDYTRLVFENGLNRVPMLAPILTFIAGRVRKTNKWNGKIAAMEKALKEADAIFDASGYTLGSGWSKAGGQQLLETIKLAKRYDTKIILMPQSFGPWEWGEDDDAEFLKKVKKELTYCTKIYPREREGYDSLMALGLDNVELSADMVIREKLFPAADDILASHKADEANYPSEGSVGFIVNENLFRFGDPEAAYDLYAKMLDKLIANGETVYMLNTSTADKHLGEQILRKTANRDKVNVISGEYSSPELIHIISRFKYVVASRYHSIVFGYRSGVPAVILGWAAKYVDLADHFEQQDYVFDIRNPDVDGIIAKIDAMGANYETESQRIKANLTKMQSTSVIEDAVKALEG